MSGSRIARRQSRNHARYRGRNDINIVPMLDVMVILIFFLIFTAVFSKMNILELNLPVDGRAAAGAAGRAGAGSDRAPGSHRGRGPQHRAAPAVAGHR